MGYWGEFIGICMVLVDCMMRWYFNEIFGFFLKDRLYVVYSLLVSLVWLDYIGNEMGW